MEREVQEYLEHRFRIIKRLGSGGSKVVYHVENLADGQPLALKLIMVDERLRSLLARSGDTVEQLVRREGIMYPVSANQHINPIYSLHFETSLNAYLIIESLCDGTLGDVLVGPLERELQRPLSIIRALYYIQQIAEGVAALHAMGKPHGDLKLSNVLVRDHVLKVSDFGLASYVSDAVNRKEAGAAGIRAPGPRPTRRSDIWELTALLFRLLTGSTSRPTIADFEQACRDSANMWPQEWVKGDVVSDWVRPLMADNPEERPEITDAMKYFSIMQGFCGRVFSSIAPWDGNRDAMFEFIVTELGGGGVASPVQICLAGLVMAYREPLPIELGIDPRFTAFVLRETNTRMAMGVVRVYLESWGALTLRQRLRTFDYDND